jgi:hypothetical protein
MQQLGKIIKRRNTISQENSPIFFDFIRLYLYNQNTYQKICNIMEKGNNKEYYLEERKQSLQTIKEYLLSLLKKNKKTGQQTSKELQDTLNSKNKEELTKKQEENLWEKMKNKLFNKTQSLKNSKD